MIFIKKITTIAKEMRGEKRVKAVYLGLSYCLAVMENGDAGLAFIFKDDLLSGCNINLPKRPLAGSKAHELLDFAGTSSLGNSIALAVANAILNTDVDADSTGDFIDNFKLTKGMTVGMVGHFGPLESIIEASGAELFIFDLHPEPFSKVLPSEMIPDVMPTCDVALITATTIINETIDDILFHAINCDYVALLGPSAPLLSKCYDNTLVSCAAGAMVRDLDRTIQAIVEAGGMRVFGKFINKVNVKV